MRAIHRARNWRFFWRRSRYAYCPAFITACLAIRYTFFLRPRKPFACLRTFLWRARAVTPRLTLGMARSLRRVRQHGPHRRGVGGIHSACAPQLPLRLGGLLGQDMAPVRRPALDAAAAAHLEALGGSLFRLHLRHCNCSCFHMTPGGSLRERLMPRLSLV